MHGHFISDISNLVWSRLLDIINEIHFALIPHNNPRWLRECVSIRTQRFNAAEHIEFHFQQAGEGILALVTSKSR